MMSALPRKDQMSGKYALYLIVFMLVGILLMKYFQNKQELKHSKSIAEQTTSVPVNNETNSQSKEASNKGIPTEAIEIFQYAMTHGGDTKKDYRGNTPFSNRERNLPQSENGVPLKYKEYDIYPWVRGHNRGPERVVISSKGVGYYTGDHYKTFIKIQ